MIQIKRFAIALALALFMAGATLAVAQAQTPPAPAAAQPSPTPTGTPRAEWKCVDCHKDVVNDWQNGPHGQSMTDPVFASAWNTQGQPGACLVCHTTGYDPTTGVSAADDVSCESCHNPAPANHPTEKMPIDNSPDLCGKCHSDPRFSTENWKLSAHYQRGMACSVCHNPHSAGMKILPGQTNQADASALCENCHKDAMKNFPASKHAEAGVTCVNCHLGFNVNSTDPSDMNVMNAHKAPDHNFTPSLDTCNKCHSTQMHAPGDAVAAAAIKIEEIGGTPTPTLVPPVTPVPPTTNDPAPVSPIGFASMAGLIGLAAGMVLAPWLERSYQNYIKGGKA